MEGFFAFLEHTMDKHPFVFILLLIIGILILPYIEKFIVYIYTKHLYPKKQDSKIELKLNDVSNKINLLEEKFHSNSKNNQIRHEQIVTTLQEIKQDIREIRHLISRERFGGL